MGFYGNITNTARTQFQFDRVYSNRYSMELSMSTDGVYAGRYVLIEYDQNPGGTEFYQEGYYNEGKIYKSPDYNNANRFKFEEIKKDEIIRVYTEAYEDPITPDSRLMLFFRCTGEISDEKFATFKEVSKSEIPYTNNYNIDVDAYGEGRGWDSTVWQKVYSQGVEKYVMIAELNTVVPTFEVDADAPTMSPIAPHFDTNSTNVHYKLHWQPQWGLRVAAQEGEPSDSPTIWVKEEYDPKTDKKKKLYFNMTDSEWKEYSSFNDVLLNENAHVPAAIHYNYAAFNNQLDTTRTSEDGIAKHVDDTNYFTILPTGKSGKTYNSHNGTGNLVEAEDIQEMRINLPAIGNMMSDAWDIIHGPYRNNARTDKNSSLQGRLDSFKEIGSNQIPVKRAADGTLVGSKINGALNYDSWNDKPNEILTDNGESPGFNRDDAWIKTEINTSNLKGGVKEGDKIDQSNNSGISIHHTFHSTDNSESTVDKNKTSDNTSTSNTYKENKLPTSNLKVEKDVINLYTPYVDAMGHVVGHNVETITLPYSYRFFETDAISSIEEADLYTTIENKNDGSNTSFITAKSSNIIADRTQDTFTINPGNKWIQTKFENDELTIAHEIHAIPTDSHNPTNTNEELDVKNKDNINIPDWDYDKAGHIIGKHDHYYTLPYGFKTIKTNGTTTAITNMATATGDIVADTTQDVLTINSHNKWIRLANNSDTDSLTIAHEVNTIDTAEKKTTNINEGSDADSKNNINIPDWTYDAAGHITGKHNHKYTLPYGYKTFITDGLKENTDDLYTKIKEDNTSEASADSSSIVASETQDTMIVNPGNKWIQTKFENDTLTIAHEIHAINEVPKSSSNLNTDNVESELNSDKITIQDIEFDKAGHVIKNQPHTYTLPFGFKTVTVANSEAVTAPASNVTADQVADNTQDTLNLQASNRWVKLDSATEDTIKFGHRMAEFAAGTEANKLYGLTQNEDHTDNLNTDNTFEVPCLSFDEAGHITEARTHKVTLPENFDKISIETSDTINVDKLTGTVGTIEADTLTDKLTLAEGNRWINIDANTTNDKVIFSHYVKEFTEKTDSTQNFNNSDNDKTFTVQTIGWDRAGHIVSSDKKTLTIPDGYKTVKIENGGANITTASEGIGGNLVAESLVDTLNIDTGNRWISLVANENDDGFKIYHKFAGEVKENGSANLQTGNNTTPNFGGEFRVFTAGIDEAGHVNNLSDYAITLPVALANEQTLIATGSSVITGIGTNEKGSITQTNANIGTLKLTGYNKGTDQGDLVDSDSINSAFAKLQNQIHAEESARNKAVSDEATARTNADTTLTTNLNQEIEDRKTAVTAEENARKAADTTLTENLNKEIENRQNAVQGEATARAEAIVAEQQARAESITAEQQARAQAIAQEVTDRNSAISTAIAPLLEELKTLQSQYSDLLARVIALEANHPVEEEPIV